MPQPRPVPVDDDCALVADDRVVKPGRRERPAHRLHHATGDDDDVQPVLVRTPQRGQRSRLEDAVAPDERAVEVGRDDLDRERKVVWKLQPLGLPPVAFTT